VAACRNGWSHDFWVEKELAEDQKQRMVKKNERARLREVMPFSLG